MNPMNASFEITPHPFDKTYTLSGSQFLIHFETLHSLFASFEEYDVKT